MEPVLIVVIVIAFLVVDAFVMWKVFGGIRSRASGRSALGASRPEASDYAVSGLSDDVASRHALGATAAASVAAAAEGRSTPPPDPAAPPSGAAAYESGFENPAPGHPGGSDDAGWSLGGGWSDSSDSGGSGSFDSGGGDSGGSSSSD